MERRRAAILATDVVGTDKLWEMADIVALIDANEPPQKKREPYKKRNPN